ncbi:hypothetical protein ACN9MI_09870 [Rhodococcoides fascians]|mgnify:CR=1 FL=1|jgi:hypothetical protein|uniref:hypothetical protein n=1 Tax=Nocardiaceae TaxID=85025 RepID=UPI00050C80B0|nr:MULTISPECIES: hypothetical protein [Rhodococcus]KJV02861.1 hypothetical protein VF34_01814 [Rhodococcus sp. PML026]WQH30374.1 hypothetical protein U2G91_10785 [Rhodococcus fascians]
MSDDGDDETTEHGVVFGDFIANGRDLEFDRQKTLEGRGGLIFRNDLAIVTAVVAIAAFAIGRFGPFRIETASFVVLGLSVCALVPSLIYSAVVQSGTSQYSLVSDETLNMMIGEKWGSSENHARFIVAARNVETLQTLRKANQSRAQNLKLALRLQIAFVFLLIAAVLTEVGLRIF